MSLKLDNLELEFSENERLLPPKRVFCNGLSFIKADLEFKDCCICRFYNRTVLGEKKYTTKDDIEIFITNHKVRRSNITNRYYCPYAIAKKINFDAIPEEVYCNSYLDIILLLYEKMENLDTCKTKKIYL